MENELKIFEVEQPPEDTTLVPNQTAPLEYAVEEEPKAPVSFMEEALPSLKSGAMLGAASLRGLPGSLMYYGTKAQNALLGREEEPYGLPPEGGQYFNREQREAIRQGNAVPFYVGSPAQDEKGRPAPFRFEQPPLAKGTLPTITGSVEDAMKNWSGASYKPETFGGDLLQSGTQWAVESILGGPKRLPSRVTSGFFGGLGAEVGEKGGSIAGPYGELFGMVLGGVGGDLAARKFGNLAVNLFSADTKAANEFAQIVAEDLASDPEKLEKIKTSLANGEDIFPFDYLSPKAMAAIQKKYTPEQIGKLANFNQALDKRQAAVQSNMQSTLDNMFGSSMADPKFAIDFKAANNAERKAIYDHFRSLPNAQSVYTPEINSALNDPFVREAVTSVARRMEEGKIPSSWGLAAPKIPSGSNQTPYLPTLMQASPPNAAFWDEVQRVLRVQADDLAKGRQSPFKTEDRAALLEARTALLDALEKPNALPEFAAVRGSAAEMFGAENALEGGYKMAQSLTGKNVFKLGDFVNNFSKATPYQKNKFAEGAARYIFKLSDGGADKVISYLESPEVRRVLPDILGPDKFDQIYGKASAGAIQSSQARLQSVADAAGGKMNLNDALQYALFSGGPATAASLVPYLQGNTTIAAALATGFAVAGAAFKKSLSASEKKVANRVFELAMSTKPDDAKKLGQLINQNYDAASSLMKMNDAISAVTNSAYNSYLNTAAKPVTDRPYQAVPIDSGISVGEANGGRVERKSGGRVANAISTEVDRTRALLSNKTASMLSMPDDAIVTALNHAKNK